MGGVGCGMRVVFGGEEGRRKRCMRLLLSFMLDSWAIPVSKWVKRTRDMFMMRFALVCSPVNG